MAHCRPHPFINTTPLEQPDRASRKNARSYVMRGKNSGKRLKHLDKRPGLGSWINAQLAAGDSEPLSHALACTNQVPRQVASEWTLFEFAEEIGPHMRQKVYQFFPILEQTSYPNQALAGNVFDRQAPLWFEHLGHSQTYVHNQLFVTMAYFDMIVTKIKGLGPITMSHMMTALSLLQTDLETMNRATAEATISTIIAFAMVAFISGDTSATQIHLQGLLKILAMRGGLSSLRTCTYLQTKCCRLDLSHAMCTYSKPVFFASHNISWNPYLPRSIPEPQISAIHLFDNDSSLDPRMVNIWSDLYEFSRAANISAQTGRKLEPDLLLEAMISVQYRLLNLDFDNKDPHELLRVVLLAYTTTILPLLFSQFGATLSLSYPSFHDCLQGYLTTLEQVSKNRLKSFLWVLVIVGISVFDTTSVELPFFQIMHALNLDSWEDILVLMKDFLWIDTLHREPVQKLLSHYYVKDK